ncbi:hypothetical protein OEZ85_000298 [Tetradesmus obliquus]|uniref:Uncharacterized protein n=1 Tax=Tetradesmus obliquus TaxID=3088 RepID=A0ABY8URM9_TETOB|nr:hypothetical protein OEZ85_000298 [Tetradesmus obliquus]
MGLLGIAVPDATYGISCQPAAGRKEGQVVCRSTKAQGNMDCTRPGVSSCTLVFWDANVTETLPQGAYLKTFNLFHSCLTGATN